MKPSPRLLRGSSTSLFQRNEGSWVHACCLFQRRAIKFWEGSQKVCGGVNGWSQQWAKEGHLVYEFSIGHKVQGANHCGREASSFFARTSRGSTAALQKMTFLKNSSWLPLMRSDYFCQEVVLPCTFLSKSRALSGGTFLKIEVKMVWPRVARCCWTNKQIIITKESPKKRCDFCEEAQKKQKFNYFSHSLKYFSL